MQRIKCVDVPTFNVLSLCSGIGGFDLGIKLAVPGARTVCYVEREAYCCQILVSRIADSCLDEAPIWSDLRTFCGQPWRRIVDCVVAGFPCQPVSRAGRRQREEHEHWLWSDILRIIRECEPGFVFGENVDALRSHGGRGIVGNLAACGYAVAWDLFSARAVGASHSRPRLFILAAKRECLDDPLYRRHRTSEEEIFTRRQGPFPPSPGILPDNTRLGGGWPEPGFQGCPDGIADRVDRLRAAGNSVVPTVVAVAWEVLLRRLTRSREKFL